MTGRRAGGNDAPMPGRGDARINVSASPRLRLSASRFRRPLVSERLLLVLLIVLVALLLRLRAAFLLPIDADEPTYMAIAGQYAADLRAGDLSSILALQSHLEHPALVKVLYAILLAIAQPADSDIALHVARLLSVAFGTAQVLLLAIINPLAGFALAIHTMTIKYTSQAYLEAVPGFFAIAAMLAFERYRRSGPPVPPMLGGESIQHDSARFWRTQGSPLRLGSLPNTITSWLRPKEQERLPSPQTWGGGGANVLWLILSAACLGATAAGKYPYLSAGLAIVPFLPWRQRTWRAIGAFFAVALLTFFALDPHLWVDPLGRLAQSLLFHPAYTQTTQVTRYGFSWFKPLDYLLHPVPWHPGVFYIGLDGWIFVLGLLGLPLLWRRSRPYTAWAIVSLVVLFLWPTKWPQYTLIAIPPLCLSLGYGIADVARWANERFQLGYYLAPFMVPRITVVLATLAGMAVALILFIEGLLYWQGNLGWQQISTHNSGLISDYVQALAEDRDGRRWIGTRSGLAVFDGETWAAYTAEAGDLPGDSVQALAVAPDGTVWAGTAHGIAAFDGTQWRQFRAAGAASGPSGDDVRGLAIDADGRVWAATTSGLSMYDGRAWTPYRAGASGLPSDLVFAVAVAGDGRIWAGTNRGVGVLDPRTQSWQRYDQTNSGLEHDAVSAIALAADGRVWLGTFGGGVTVFDGQAWKTLTTANSDLPWNTIMALSASPRGDIWVAADLPASAGGNVARWDGKTWTTFTPQRSGIAGGSATCFAFDSLGRTIIGMRSAGVSIYAPRSTQSK